MLVGGIVPSGPNRFGFFLILLADIGVLWVKLKQNHHLLHPSMKSKTKISKFTERMSRRQRSAVLKASNVLAELSASEKHAALNVIRQRDTNGGLNYPWLASFFKVLSKMKAEESRSEDK